MQWQEAYLPKYYSSNDGFVNGTSEYFEFIRHDVPAGAEVLELGPGPENPASAFLAEHFAAVDGLDIDEKCAPNPYLRRMHIYSGGRFPVEDNSHDAVASNYVFEHVERPSVLVGEIVRVLRPGGVCVFRAPNAWHCVSVVTRFTPHSFHLLVSTQLRNREETEHDPYPTFFRMNTVRTLKKIFGRAGLDALELRMVEKEHSYGMSSRTSFLLFMLCVRLVNSTAALAGIRANIFGAFRKP